MRALFALFVLIVAHWQVQHVFACSMMDDGVHEQCCCGTHESMRDCIEVDRRSADVGDDDPCCTHSPEIGFDLEGRQDSPASSSGQFRPNLDPPVPLELPVSAFAPPSSSAARHTVWRPQAEHIPTSDVYLITRRLRI